MTVVAEIRWHPFEQILAGSLSRLAQRQYGKSSYQAKPEYLRWLYEENPHSGGYKDLLVATDAADEVVGCIHKMRLPWTLGGEPHSVPTLHNLVIDEKYRGGGGFWLLKRSFHGENFALIPGVVKPLAEAYQHMKCQSVSSRWYRRILNPVKVGLTMLETKFFGLEGAFSPRPLAFRSSNASLVIPGEADFVAIADHMNRESGGDHVQWDAALVKWRFFHDLGPRHHLLKSHADSGFALLALGLRHGFPVARLVGLSLPEKTQEMQIAFLRDVGRFARRRGASVLFAMTTHPDLGALYERMHMKPYPELPETYFYAKQRGVSYDLGFGPEVTDFGFEALAEPARRAL